MRTPRWDALRYPSVIPIRDHNHTRRTPIVTWTLIAANALIFVWSMAFGASHAEAVVMRFGVIPEVLVHGDWQLMRTSGGAVGAVVTPFTSMFLHGGLLHLGFNMLFLHVFGDNVEDVLGRGRFVGFYSVCGLGAVAGQVLVDTNSMIPMIGASGAISGVLAGYMILFPHARIVTLIPIFIFIRFVELPAAVFIILWFGLQLVLGYLSLGLLAEAGSGVAWFAHIGGFLAGLVCVKLFYRSPRTRRDRLFR
ncbi:MAG: rhomboid family intramembrane serine protease [Myxococcota bacterium]